MTLLELALWKFAQTIFTDLSTWNGLLTMKWIFWILALFICWHLYICWADIKIYYSEADNIQVLFWRENSKQLFDGYRPFQVPRSVFQNWVWFPAIYSKNKYRPNLFPKLGSWFFLKTLFIMPIPRFVCYWFLSLRI